MKETSLPKIATKTVARTIVRRQAKKVFGGDTLLASLAIAAIGWFIRKKI